jgi:NtrC-family two-component system response regulator AlgB
MDVLIIDDEKAVRDSTLLALEMEDHYAEAVSSGMVGIQRLKEEVFDLVFLDLNLGSENGLDILPQIHKRHPHLPIVMFTAEASVATAVKAIQLGAMDYLEKPFTPDQLRGVVARAKQWQQLQEKIVELQTEISTHSPPPLFKSADRGMNETLDLLFRAAPTPASILILGESGTGKSLVAREIHQRSHLKDKPFVTISCPSLSKELLESELFGHVKGSFTGAIKDKMGKVHEANGGTLFLDEIGELPLDIQPKLLRLLQEREYERLGDTKTRQADVRVIAATNRDLRKSVEKGEFREDLFYRLDVISVTMPPLRERPKDLQKFAENFVDFFAKQSARKIDGFTEEARTRLLAHQWPGNLRELRNAIERAVILTRGSKLEESDLPKPTNVTTEEKEGDGAGASGAGAFISIEELEAEHIRRILRQTKTLQEAADVLGIDQATLYRKRKKLAID